MISYLINFSLCSAMLFAVYAFLLQSKVIYGFNRFYLLFSICFSVAVPLIVIEKTLPAVPQTVQQPANNFDYSTIITNATQPSTSIKAEVNYWVYACPVIYTLVAGCLLLRFAFNLLKIRRLIRLNKRIVFNEMKLVLIKDKIAPHSFLNFIFLNNDDYDNGDISNDILEHEQAHIKQRHTTDILLVEFLQAVCWFNPVLILYRRAIRLNHEFLADAAVLRHKADVKDYQHLLLNQFTNTQSLSIASQFNYSTTKKRLIMMTKHTSRGASVFARVAAMMFLTCAFVLFCKTTEAFQQSEVQPAKQKVKAAKSHVKAGKSSLKTFHIHFVKYRHTKEGVSQELINEYASIVAKYENVPKDGDKFYATISPEDKTRMEEIFGQMSIEQQGEQKIGFRFPSEKLPKKVPTQTQFNSWKDSKMYGLWIDDKRVQNNVLNNYKATDLNLVFVSKLMPNAINYKNHKYQVDLMTVKAYEEYLKKPQPKYLMYHLYRPNNKPNGVVLSML